MGAPLSSASSAKCPCAWWSPRLGACLPAALSGAWLQDCWVDSSFAAFAFVTMCLLVSRCAGVIILSCCFGGRMVVVMSPQEPSLSVGRSGLGAGGELLGRACTPFSGVSIRDVCRPCDRTGLFCQAAGFGWETAILRTAEPAPWCKPRGPHHPTPSEPPNTTHRDFGVLSLPRTIQEIGFCATTECATAIPGTCSPERDVAACADTRPADGGPRGLAPAPQRAASPLLLE